MIKKEVRGPRRLDQTDLAIMEYVRLHPIATIAEIAKRLPGRLSRPATQVRVTRLLKSRRIRRGLEVDLSALGFKYKYRIDIRIRPSELLDSDNRAVNKLMVAAGKRWKTSNPQEMLAFYIAEDIMDEINNDVELKGKVLVDDVCILLGDPADMCATVRVRDPDAIFPFVTKKIRGITGVDNTSTCIEAWSCSSVRKMRMLAERPRKQRGTRGGSSPRVRNS